MADYVCEYCGQHWRYPIAAALCCDALVNDLDDETRSWS